MEVILKANQMDPPEEQRSPKSLGKFKEYSNIQ